LHFLAGRHVDDQAPDVIVPVDRRVGVDDDVAALDDGFAVATSGPDPHLHPRKPPGSA